MPILTTTPSGDPFNRPIYGYDGRFTLSHAGVIPYFACVMPIERIIGELRIAEEIAPSIENPWTLTELFQREVDRDRVKKEIVDGYLKDPNKLKFFNSITVALLPKTADGQLLASFSDSEQSKAALPSDPNDPNEREWHAAVESGDARIHDFGGVQYAVVAEQARLRWNEDTVHPVAVDGQHRLAALKLLKADVDNLTAEDRETRISVLFLMLDESCGFEAPSLNQRTIKNISREIFTDLNKNARKVDRARELILDDWSLEARCCRSLITDETARDSNCEIPLTLVRWQDSNHRFDSSYYINSLVNLEQLTNIVLDLKPPTNPLEKKDALDFIKSVTDAVGTNGKLLSEDGQDLKEHYESTYIGDDDSPIYPLYRLPSEWLEPAVKCFNERHKPWLIRVLTALPIYEELFEAARDQNLIEGPFGKFNAQTQRHREKIGKDKGTHWIDQNVELPKQRLSELKEDRWEFKSIFQKALVRLAKEVVTSYSNEAHLGDIDTLMTFLGKASDEGLFQIKRPLDTRDTMLWTFIAINPGNEKIKVNKQVESRIYSLLKIWYFSYLQRTEAMTSAQFAKKMRAVASCTQWPGCDEAMQALDKCFDSRMFFGEQSADMPKAKKQQLIRDRMSHVIAAAGHLKFATDQQ